MILIHKHQINICLISSDMKHLSADQRSIKDVKGSRRHVRTSEARWTQCCEVFLVKIGLFEQPRVSLAGLRSTMLTLTMLTPTLKSFHPKYFHQVEGGRCRRFSCYQRRSHERDGGRRGEGTPSRRCRLARWLVLITATTKRLPRDIPAASEAPTMTQPHRRQVKNRRLHPLETKMAAERQSQQEARRGVPVRARSRPRFALHLLRDGLVVGTISKI